MQLAQQQRRLPQLHEYLHLLPQISETKPEGAQYVLSPSQLDTYDQCKRKWAFQYIAGIRSPPHASAVLGTLVHAHLESWLSEAVPPGQREPRDRFNNKIKATDKQYAKAISIASRMIRHMPPPGIATVERNFFFTTRLGHVYQGFIDFSFDGRLYAHVAENLFKLPTVGDHKTTGDLDYAKSEEDLHNDLQGVIYTLAGCIIFRTEELLLFWNYGTTKTAEAVVHPVATAVSLAEAFEKFERVIEPVAAEIIAHRRAANDPNSFPPTLSACNNYGGCHYRKIGRCIVSDQERMRHDMNDGTNGTNGTAPADMSMAARMAAFPSPPMNGFAQPPGAPSGPGGFPLPPGFQPVAPAPLQTNFQTPGYNPSQPYGGQQLQTHLPPVPQQTSGYIAPAVQVVAPMHPAQQPGQPPFAMPPGYPQTPQQPALPFTGALPPAPAPYSPEQGPNPPESGQRVNAAPPPPAAAPTAQETEEGKAAAKAKRGAGRPPGSTNKEMTREQSIWIEGAKARMMSPSFAGDPDLIISAGNLMLQAFKARFDKE